MVDTYKKIWSSKIIFLLSSIVCESTDLDVVKKVLVDAEQSKNFTITFLCWMASRVNELGSIAHRRFFLLSRVPSACFAYWCHNLYKVHMFCIFLAHFLHIFAYIASWWMCCIIVLIGLALCIFFAYTLHIVCAGARFWNVIHFSTWDPESGSDQSDFRQF